MARAKKVNSQYAIKKRAGRKTTPRRKTEDRRTSNPGDVFWTKVTNGFKKFLESPFK